MIIVLIPNKCNKAHEIIRQFLSSKIVDITRLSYSWAAVSNRLWLNSLVVFRNTFNLTLLSPSNKQCEFVVMPTRIQNFCETKCYTVYHCKSETILSCDFPYQWKLLSRECNFCNQHFKGMFAKYHDAYVTCTTYSTY